jgi:hypothetical protein
VKPGVYTTEFTAVAGVIAAIFGGVVTTEHSQIVAGVIVGAYAFLRTVLKAVNAWKNPAA